MNMAKSSKLVFTLVFVKKIGEISLDLLKPWQILRYYYSEITIPFEIKFPAEHRVAVFLNYFFFKHN